MSIDFDLIIIGSGPGGYVAAIRASQLGMKTAIVEANELGGICLNWGCIPTKALLKSSDTGRLTQKSELFGWIVSDVKPDLDGIVNYSRDAAQKLSAGVKYLMKKNGIKVFQGWGKLLGKGKIEIAKDDTTQIVCASNIIIATGARSRTIPELQPDGKNIVTSRDAMVPKKLPERLLVVGSGAIGVEFSTFYNELGSAVTIMELEENIVPAEDEEISQMAKKLFVRQGINILTKTSYLTAHSKKNGIEVVYQTGDGSEKIAVFDQIISAIGVTGNIEKIGLENTLVEIDRDRIKTDQWMETAEPGIYAIGDVAGGPWLAHKASHEAITCVEKIAGVGSKHPIDKFLIPGCTYSHPQIASVGLTESLALEMGYELKIGRFPFAGNGKAVALGETEGLIKLIFEKNSGAILGAHMIGVGVTELITTICVAMKLEATEEDLMQMIFPHPTLSETIHEATLNAYNRSLHI